MDNTTLSQSTDATAAISALVAAPVTTDSGVVEVAANVILSNISNDPTEVHAIVVSDVAAALAATPAITDPVANAVVTTAAASAITAAVSDTATSDSIAEAIVSDVTNAPAVADELHAAAAILAISNLIVSVAPDATIVTDGTIDSVITNAVTTDAVASTENTSQVVTETPAVEQVVEQSHVTEEIAEQAPVEQVIQTPVQTPVVEEVKQVEAVPVVTQQAPAPVVADTTLNVLLGATTYGEMLYNDLLDYVSDMQINKPMHIESGVRHQRKLYSTIVSIINKLDTDFDVVFGALLKLVYENSAGVFHDSHVYRFMEHVTLSKNEAESFQRLMNLLKHTADPKGRVVAVKQINMEKTLHHGITEEGRQRLFHFYQI